MQEKHRDFVIKVVEMEDKIIEQIDFDINATTGDDDYSVGLRNGLRLAKSLINGEQPIFEHVENVANRD